MMMNKIELYHRAKLFLNKSRHLLLFLMVVFFIAVFYSVFNYSVSGKERLTQREKELLWISQHRNAPGISFKNISLWRTSEEASEVIASLIKKNGIEAKITFSGDNDVILSLDKIKFVLLVKLINELRSEAGLYVHRLDIQAEEKGEGMITVLTLEMKMME